MEDNGIGMDTDQLNSPKVLVDEYPLAGRLMDGRGWMHSSPGKGMSVGVEFEVKIRGHDKIFIIDDHPMVIAGIRQIPQTLTTCRLWAVLRWLRSFGGFEKQPADVAPVDINLSDL
ncbi:MAG: response regulator transcription factor [Saprospiraceae bacterium]|nr:response regulator transcription factor [Saprospiraceae bacterium]